MYYLDPESYLEKLQPLDSVQLFFDRTLPNINFGTDKEETVMDIGCGPGRVTAVLIPPLFPNMKKLIGFDLLPYMIEYARTHHPHKKIDYSVGSIEDWSTIEHWEGQISSILSIHCFNWVKNQRKSFQNVYKLLQCGGQAAFLFCVHTPYFQAVVEIAKDPKWREYFKDVDNCIPESHFQKYDALYYKEMVEEIGFSVVHIELGLIPDSFATDQLFRNFFASICVLVSHVPADRREEFKDDLFQYNIRLNGRNDEGQPSHKGTMLQLVVKKN